MTDWMRRLTGCGCAAVLLIIVTVSVGLWGLSFMDKPAPMRTLQPVPDNVPPQIPAEVDSIDINAPGRTSDKLTQWSTQLSQQTGIPGQALRAYANAELIAREAWPECNLRWNTLAGVGWVETRHGTYSGNWFKPSELDANGYTTPPIIGIPLDGANGTARVADTDDGAYDGDPELDRAMGPMQFIPESWKRYGLDANGDGKADPQQIDDAALSSAKLLCAFNRNLADGEAWVQAIFSYNQSEDYMRRVANAANSYAIGQPATS